MERHVLVVLPHPDDESFGCGGAIALHTNAGTPVTYACGTLGEMGRNMGRPFFATRESLPKIREKELRNACDALAVRDLRLMGLRDKTVEFEDPERLADRIEAFIKELQPSLILTFYPGHAVHPDHDAMGAATIRAVARFAKENRPVVHCMAITKNRETILGKPDVTIDISAVREQKLNAIKAHRSQTEALFANWEEEKKKNPDYIKRMEQNWQKEVYWTYSFEN
ncbi:bacillithiol biosynthesis deacetylase BshB2 [Fodinisporobacter ferrooxydans]|uniref:Bacillithiol biosynthesis deacetylase BshB2 n=1 Tax=Fodinisporobacter ferrooxydans TaxID=2901836 RepID=A0ABY4CL48_9BACL|nr:bacillithiol biosynthesis deacetylase BshB2 [Alicyclobacillaceae bacterium MYW30-H2]